MAMTNNEIDFIEYDPEQIVSTVLNQLEASVGEPLYPGDERTIFGRAMSGVLIAAFAQINDESKQRLLRYARGTVLDALGERIRPPVTRRQPAHSTAVLRFSVATVSLQNIIVPQGTRATGDSVHYFASDTEVVIQAGSLFAEVTATCTTGGSSGNGFLPGTINTLVDVVPYVSSVSNTSLSTGGDDGEPYTLIGDDKYRERIRTAPVVTSTAGAVGAYEYWTRQANLEIGSVRVISPAPCEVAVYPLMSDGSLPDQAVLDQVTSTLSADDVRPLTDLVHVLAPTTASYDIEVKYYTTLEAEGDTINAIESAGGAIDQYVAWQDVVLGRDINPDQLRKNILAPKNAEGTSLQGALRVDVISPSFTTVGPEQVAKFSGNSIVTHEVVAE